MAKSAATMDPKITRKLNSTNPFLPGFQSTNPFNDDSYYSDSKDSFVDVGHNFNSTNPFINVNFNSPNPIFKDYDNLDKSVIQPDNNRSIQNRLSSTVAHQSSKVLNCVNIAVDGNNGSDSDSDNMAAPSMADLNRSQMQLTIKVDNIMQALEKLTVLDGAHKQRK
jgi:hypothetical protein